MSIKLQQKVVNIKKILDLTDKNQDSYLKKYLMQAYILLVLEILKNQAKVSKNTLKHFNEIYGRLRLHGVVTNAPLSGASLRPER